MGWEQGGRDKGKGTSSGSRRRREQEQGQGSWAGRGRGRVRGRRAWGQGRAGSVAFEAEYGFGSMGWGGWTGGLGAVLCRGRGRPAGHLGHCSEQRAATALCCAALVGKWTLSIVHRCSYPFLTLHIHTRISRLEVYVCLVVLLRVTRVLRARR